MYKRLAISMAAATTLAVTATAGAAQAQAYAYGRAASDEGGYHRGGGFTLLGARAGVTVLGVDLDGSGDLRIGLHDHHRRGGRHAYAAPPAEYGPPEEAYGPPQGYGPTPAYAAGYASYGDVGYPAAPAYSYGGGYGYPTPYAYRPCGC